MVKPSRSAVLLGVAVTAAALLALALELLRAPARGFAASGSADGVANEPAGPAWSRASAEASRSLPEDLDLPSSPAPIEPPDPDLAPPEVDPERSLWGFVLEAESGAGIADCRVDLGGAETASTDGAGRFITKIPAGTEVGAQLEVVRVQRGEREVLFHGSALVRPGMEILVRPPIALRGHIVDPSGNPVRAQSVAAYLEPEGLREIEWFLASTLEVSENGRFEIQARAVPEQPRSLELRIGLRSSTVRASVDWNALRSDAGATLVVDSCLVRLVLLAADERAPIDEAELRLAAWIGAAEVPVARTYLIVEPGTPLEFDLPAAATAIELAVGAPGFAPLVERRGATPCDETWALALSRLGPDDVLQGAVVDVAGEPVAGAFASCNPATRDGDVGAAAHAGARTDARGRFSLPFARGQVAEVRAYHRDHGMTPEMEAVGGRRDLVLCFLGLQDVDVAPQFPASEGISASGHPFEWALALQDGSERSGSERTAPFAIEEVPPGEHRLFLLAVDGAYFASAPLSVFPAVNPRVELWMQPARRARGHVFGPDGSPAPAVQVRLVDPTWTNRLVDRWGSTTTDGEGSFDVFVGFSTEVTLAFSREGRESLRTTVASLAPLEIRLPSGP